MKWGKEPLMQRNAKWNSTLATLSSKLIWNPAAAFSSALQSSFNLNPINIFQVVVARRFRRLTLEAESVRISCRAVGSSGRLTGREEQKKSGRRAKEKKKKKKEGSGGNPRWDSVDMSRWLAKGNPIHSCNKRLSSDQSTFCSSSLKIIMFHLFTAIQVQGPRSQYHFIAGSASSWLINLFPVFFYKSMIWKTIKSN